jgi:hypothetical protein
MIAPVSINRQALARSYIGRWVRHSTMSQTGYEPVFEFKQYSNPVVLPFKVLPWFNTQFIACGASRKQPDNKTYIENKPNDNKIHSLETDILASNNPGYDVTYCFCS